MEYVKSNTKSILHTRIFLQEATIADKHRSRRRSRPCHDVARPGSRVCNASSLVREEGEEEAVEIEGEGRHEEAKEPYLEHDHK